MIFGLKGFFHFTHCLIVVIKKRNHLQIINRCFLVIYQPYCTYFLQQPNDAYKGKQKTNPNYKCLKFLFILNSNLTPAFQQVDNCIQIMRLFLWFVWRLKAIGIGSHPNRDCVRPG